MLLTSCYDGLLAVSWLQYPATASVTAQWVAGDWRMTSVLAAGTIVMATPAYSNVISKCVIKK